MARTKEMLTINDLDWKGMYQIPASGNATAGGPGTPSYSSGALAVRYVNGERRILTVMFAQTPGITFADLVEYKEPVMPKTIDKNTAPALIETRRWKNWSLAGVNPAWTNVVNNVRVGGLYWDEAKGVLWYQIYGYYSAANMPFLGATQLLDTVVSGNYCEVGTRHGPWWYRDKTAGKLFWKMVDYWILPTPESSLADLGNNDLIAGASVGSIGGPGHIGPGFHAIHKPDLNDPPDTVIPLGKRIVDYSSENPTPTLKLEAARRSGNYSTLVTTSGLFSPDNGVGYWQMSLDQVNSYIWVETATKEGILLFGRQCAGMTWYGFNPWSTSPVCQTANPPATCSITAVDPTRGIGPGNGYGATQWSGALFAFDPEDVRASGRGEISPYADGINPSNLGDWKVKWPTMPTASSGRYVDSLISNTGFWDATAKEIIWIQPLSTGNARPTVQFFTVLETEQPDTMPPVITIVSPLDGAIVSGTVLISGTAKDDKAVKSVEISFDGSPFEPVQGLEVWTFALDTLAQVNGIHVITVKATDTSGNTAEKSLTVDVQNDIIPPVFSPVVQKTLLEFSGTLTDDSGIRAVTLSLDGGPESTVGIETWSYTLDVTGLSDGTHTLTLKAVDNAGNAQTMTYSFELPIGLTAPLQKKINEFIISADKAQMHLDAAQKELDEIK